MHGRVRWGAAGLIVGLAAALALPSFAQTAPTPSPGATARTVTVTGTATIRSAPDEAGVTLGVQTQSQSAQDAMQQNANKMSDVLKSLADLGIRRDDIATSGISLYPNYGNNGQDITSYTAQNQVDVTVHDLGSVGKVIDRAVAAGANLTTGIAFQLSNQNQGLDEALKRAVADARSKAEVLSQAGGASLGDVISITEGAPPVPPIYASAAAGAPTPVVPPTLETQVSVSVTWALV